MSECDSEVKVDYVSKLRFIIVKFNWLKNMTDKHTYTYLLVFGVFENKEFINTYYLIITYILKVTDVVMQKKHFLNNRYFETRNGHVNSILYYIHKKYLK